MSKALILRGLPASGKSTKAKEICQKDGSWVRVCRDDLRHMRGKYWMPRQEDMITEMERACIKAAAESGKNVIIDATNLNERYLPNLKRFLGQYYETIEIDDDFLNDPWKCIERDMARENSVGREVILRMFFQYMSGVTKYYRDHMKPRAIVFDIDGTIAKMGDRSPYDWSKVHLDDAHVQVAELCAYYKATGRKVIILTGRDGSCLNLTKAWLKDIAGVDYDEIYIREEGDKRKDWIIKNELFDTHIANMYDVEAVFDDRPQMIDFWKAKGLYVFNCNQDTRTDF